MKRMLFVILAVAFSTNVPSPLFPLYQSLYGLNTAMITTLFAVYAAGVLLMLLIGGAIAERTGPRLIALLGVGLAAVAALLFITARSAAMLYAGRLLGGVAVGAFMGTSNTLLLQMTTPDLRARILGLSSTLNLFGYGLGPVLGGLWLQLVHVRSAQAPFVILLLVLLAAFAALFSLKQPFERPAAFSAFAIRLGVPPTGRSLFWGIAAPAIFAGFAFGGIAFTLLPGLARAAFGPGVPGIGGILIFVMTTVGALAQLAPRPSDSRVRLAWGLAILAAGSWVSIPGESLAKPALILLAAALQGMGNGWTFQASLRLAGEVAVQGDRVRVMSTYFICGYAGLSLPVVGAGELSLAIGVLPSLEVTGALLTLVLLVAAVLARRAPLALGEAPAEERVSERSRRSA